jgi:O-antigen/teichoic acid export membrane protein
MSQDPGADPTSSSEGEAAPSQPPAPKQASNVLAALKVGRGTLWTIGGYGVSTGMRLAGNLILTRLLFPEAFGLMAIINTVIQGLMLFTDLGISPCIIQHERGEEPRFLNTAFAIQNVRGVAMTICCAALAYPVAQFYASTDPMAHELLWYLPVAGFSALLDGFVSTRLFSARRQLKWPEITKLEVMAQASMLVVTIVWAYYHRSVWALVGGRVAFSASRTALSYLYLKGERNWPTWEPLAARQLFHFGKWIFISTMLTFLAGQLDKLMLGKVVDLAVLGVYGIAANMATLPTGVLLKLGGKVFFPVFSRLKDDSEALLKAFSGVRYPMLLAGAAMLAFLIPGGPALIDVLYDDRYLEAGWILQILLVGAWFKVLEEPLSAIMLATGHTAWLAVGNALKLVAVLLLLPLGFLYAGGLWGAAWGLVASDAIKYLYGVIRVRRLGFRVFLADLAYGGLLFLTVVLGAYVAAWLEESYQPHALVQLVAAGSAGALPWVPLALIVWTRRRSAK